MSAFESYEWYLRADLSRYAGKWVAITGKEVIAAGEHLQDVLRDAKARTRERPLITRVSGKLRIL